MWDEELWRDVWQRMVHSLPRLGAALLLLLVFWILARGLSRVIQRLTRVKRLDPTLTSYIGQAAYLGLLLFGIVTALGTMGVDVTALVAGLGLTGFVLGFALKDIVSNALSGILVLLYRPFRVQDRIKVQDYEGQVTDINLRYTVLEAEGKRMLIPILTSEPGA